MRTTELSIEDVIEMEDGRCVRVRLGPARRDIVRDWRGRVAVRNIDTNRLSYIPERRLIQFKQRRG